MFKEGDKVIGKPGTKYEGKTGKIISKAITVQVGRCIPKEWSVLWDGDKKEMVVLEKDLMKSNLRNNKPIDPDSLRHHKPVKKLRDIQPHG